MWNIPKHLRAHAVSSTMIWLVIFMALVTIFFARSGLSPDEYIAQKLVANVAKLDYDRLTFAGEEVVLDERNISGIQKLEKELLVTQFSIYQFLLYHKRAPLYFPYIESVLADHDVPDDFKYLAVAESGLRNDAYSSASAAGIWQFIPETGRRYGLYIWEYIDERYHFEKSTQAAAQYLAYIHDLIERNGYKDWSWTLAAAGYNRWENGILVDLEGQPTADGYYDLILNSETGAYLYRIIAIKYLMELRSSLFPKQVLDKTFSLPDTKTRSIVGPLLDLRVWCLQNDVDYYELRELNPWILSHVLPEWTWEVELLR